MRVVISPPKPKSSQSRWYPEFVALPLEDTNEAAAFFGELCQEFRPIGLLEEGQVATIAKLLWRKFRLRIFLSVEDAKAKAHRQRIDELFAATKLSESPSQKLREALTEACKKDEPVEEDEERQQWLADLADLDLARYCKELDLIERLDADIERAVGRLQKLQTWRRSGALSPPAADHRAPRWGRVRQ